jgi:hypothetical protein
MEMETLRTKLDELEKDAEFVAAFMKAGPRLREVFVALLVELSIREGSGGEKLEGSAVLGQLVQFCDAFNNRKPGPTLVKGPKKLNRAIGSHGS